MCERTATFPMEIIDTVMSYKLFRYEHYIVETKDCFWNPFFHFPDISTLTICQAIVEIIFGFNFNCSVTDSCKIMAIYHLQAWVNL